jgi:hypothetical protein
MDQEKLNQAVRSLVPHSNTAPQNSTGSEISRRLSTSATESGINALSLVDSPRVSSATFTAARAVLQANFGTEYADAKMALLFDLIRDDNWTEYQFNETLKWFLKNKPFPAWTVADWFSYGVKLYPHSWMVKEMMNDRGMDGIEIYLVGGAFLFKRVDGVTLPMKRVPFVKGRIEWCEGCDANFDAERYEKCNGDNYHAPRNRLIYPMPIGVNPESFTSKED